MLSGISASLGVTSPSSVRAGRGCRDALMSGERRCSRRTVGVYRCPPSNRLSFRLQWIAGGEGTFSAHTENGLVSDAGASEFPAVDVWLVPRLDLIKEACF